MRRKRDIERRHARWAEFRFSIIGPLLAAPPRRGELHAELERLAERSWRHPVTGKPVRVAVSTLERWYYKAQHAKRDPVGALRRRVCSDSGRQSALGGSLRQALLVQYREHPSWSYRLHFDNLKALVEQRPELGSMVSYSTLLRFMKSHALFKRRRRRADRPGSQRAAARLAEREVRSYEAEAVGALWHLDFHHGSRQVLMPDGRYVKPYLLGVLDDHSRLCCHLQWYLGETAENLVHGLGQALQKRGLPRALLTDNGAAMIASEVEQGLVRLGIVHETTLPESPYQNGKQESFWASVEGRLMAMLEGVRDLALPALNEATLAWAEMEYNRKVHSEISEPPLQRFLRGPDRSRRPPASEELRLAFTTEVLRRQRRSDGTASLDGVRFEIPGRYRQFERVALRHASWDLSRVWLADPRHGHVLCPIYPVDKARNASGQRRTLEPILAPPRTQPPASSMAPLLRALLERYAATGLPPAYLPQPATDTDPEEKP